MDRERLKGLLEAVQQGATPVEEALRSIRHMPFEDLGFARVDGHRTLRKGFSEVVFCAGKTVEHTVAIFERLAAVETQVLGTRASREQFEAVAARLPGARYDELARIILVGDDPPLRTDRKIIVATGGTSDIPVAQEALLTARWMGVPAEGLFDVGVAGLHRLLKHLDVLHEASCIVAVAGMEGALPSVLAGLVATPVIAVPTSIGYGAHFGGLAPLLTMLNSCATGVAVVNIDNGFGAGNMAALIALGNERSAQQGAAL